MWWPASAKPLPGGESRPRYSATTVRCSPPNSAVRAGSRWRSNSVSSACGSIIPGPTIPKPAARWSGSTKPKRSGSRAQTPATTIRALQGQLDRFAGYYNTTRPHRSIGRRTPAQAYADRPKAIPTGIKIPAHYRVRNDTIDSGGTVTLRHNSRLHHIGLGAATRGTHVTLLIDDLHIRVIGRDTGQLICELILDPTRDYQPRGLPPGPPKKATK